VGFILRNASRYLARHPSEKDVLAVFAGQRPLVRPPNKDGGATKAISRNHEVLVSDSGLVTIVGGKWTTYRKMAEDTLNHAVQIGGLDDKPCVTETLQLHGWRSPNAAPLPDYLGVYGADASKIEELIASDPGMGELLHPRLPYVKACVIWAIRMESARSVEDILARRTRALFLDAHAAIEMAPRVAEWMAQELKRDASWKDSQFQQFLSLAKGYCLSP
ncbi:MAG: glycerol-3-phosphate dehydrogenase C-terminal domain-containing protein, partial [Chthoniobacterales bacterium]